MFYVLLCLFFFFFLNTLSTFQVVFTPGQQDKCFLCGQMGHLAANCEGKAKRKAGEFDEKGDVEVVAKKPFQVTFQCTKIINFWISCSFSKKKKISDFPVVIHSNVTFQNLFDASVSVSQHLDSSGVFGIWFENSQSSFCDWFRAYCWWLHIYVLLRWQWFSTTYAHTGDSRGVCSIRTGFILCICYDWRFPLTTRFVPKNDIYIYIFLDMLWWFSLYLWINISLTV